MSAAKRRIALRKLLETGRTLAVPGAYDAVSAALVQAAGFAAVYVGSYATAASRLGQPDVGIVSLPEMAAHAQSVVDAVNVPVIADFEDGFGKPPNLWRSVREFERAGVSAIHIEDHVHGKHTDLQRVIRPLPQMLDRLKATLDAREDANMLVIARTDAAWLDRDPTEAVDRMNAFLEAGADMVFPAGMQPDRLGAVRRQIKGKVVVTNFRGVSVADEEVAGADVVLYYGFCLYAAFRGVQTALAAFASERDFNKVPAVVGSIDEFERFIGYAGFAERARKYGLA
jgi:2-methylisocitrate lyase-like PEP mutase family enzyme